MRGWVTLAIVLTTNTFFHFLQAGKVQKLETEIILLQTIIGSTLCLGVEPIDNGTMN